MGEVTLNDFPQLLTRAQATVISIDTQNNIITAQLNHFSVVAVTGRNGTPPRDLGQPKPGDLLYKLGTLFSSRESTSWSPGHVGIYTGEKTYPGTGLASDKVKELGIYNTIEALGKAVQYSYYDIPDITETHENQLSSFNGRDVFMGAREPLDATLTETQRETVVSYVESQIGKPYAVTQTVGSALSMLPGSVVKGPDAFNCVGLTEKAYESAGINGGVGLVPPEDEERIITVAEQYNKTKPAGGPPPIPEIISASLTPSSGTECTSVFVKIVTDHNYGLEYLDSVTYVTDAGLADPNVLINDLGQQGDLVVGDGIFSTSASAGGRANNGTLGLNFTLTDVYGKTDFVRLVYTYTETCRRSE